MSEALDVLVKPLAGFHFWHSEDGHTFALTMQFADGSAVLGSMPAAYLDELIRLAEHARTTLAATRLSPPADNDR